MKNPFYVPGLTESVEQELKVHAATASAQPKKRKKN